MEQARAGGQRFHRRHREEPGAGPYQRDRHRGGALLEFRRQGRRHGLGLGAEHERADRHGHHRAPGPDAETHRRTRRRVDRGRGGRTEPCDRAHRRRERLRMGQQPIRAAGQRHVAEQQHPGARLLFDRRGRDLRRSRSQPGRAERRLRVELGVQPPRGARGRHGHEPERAGSRRAAERIRAREHRAGWSRREPFARSAIRRDAVGMGPQQFRSARRRERSPPATVPSRSWASRA